MLAAAPAAPTARAVWGLVLVGPRSCLTAAPTEVTALAWAGRVSEGANAKRDRTRDGTSRDVNAKGQEGEDELAKEVRKGGMAGAAARPAPQGPPFLTRGLPDSHPETGCSQVLAKRKQCP